MFFEILLFTAAGSLLGIAAGLVPGLHPNTVLLLLFALPLLAYGVGPYQLISLVVSMAVTNTIVNFIPSIFLGAPEGETALSVLPGHRMLLRGEGYSALFMTVAGGIFVTLFTVISLPFMMWFIPFIYSGMHMYTHVLLLILLAVLLRMERGHAKKALSFFMFAVSGMAGFMLLSSLPQETVLFPALGGLFGLPLLIAGSSVSSFPRQKTRRNVRFSPLKGGLAGWGSGLLVGLLPGIGSAQAGVLSNALLRGREKDFLVALGGINTANILFTFVALGTIAKARSGAATFIYEAIGVPGASELCLIALIALLSCFTASAATLWLGKRSARLLYGADYGKLNACVVIFIYAMALLFTGVAGMIILTLCTIIGLSCHMAGVKKMYLMGFLMLPTILYFSGINPAALIFMGW